MQDRDKILDKVQKLLRLAADPSNVNEAASAAKRAQEMMHKYNLTSLMVESFDSNPMEDEDIKCMTDPLFIFKKNASTWKTKLAMVVAKANHCRIWLQRSHNSSRLGLVGRRSDAEVVRFLYHYLLKEVERLALRDAMGKGRSWANNFRLGAIDTIEERLKEALTESEETLKKECEKSGVAIVHINTAIVNLSNRGSSVQRWMKENMNLSKGGNRVSNWHNGARMAGRRAAQEIDLTPTQNKLAS